LSFSFLSVKGAFISTLRKYSLDFPLNVEKAVSRNNFFLTCPFMSDILK